MRVEVADTRVGEHLELDVANADALDAFHHPFAFVAPRGDANPAPAVQAGDERRRSK